jgi:GntR family transcriptional regulator, N-acetylglucosamine utilization regulator
MALYNRATLGPLSSCSTAVGASSQSKAAIDRHSGIPLFLQLTQALRATLTLSVQEGTLKPGDFFTTEKAVCERFGVSTITAKRALDDLEAEGVLMRQRGRGTYVAHPRVTQVLDHFYRFTTEMRARGLKPTWKNLYIGVGTPEPLVAETLGIPMLEKVTRLERLRMLNDEPFFAENSYLPQSLFPGLEGQDHESIALYDILGQKYKLQPVRCRQTFEPILLDRRTARLLQARTGDPGMLVEHRAFSAEGVPLEYSRGVIRGDRCRLTVDLR